MARHAVTSIVLTPTSHLSRLGFVALALALFPAAAIASADRPGAADPLGCGETVHDPDGELDVAALNPTIRTTASMLDADIRIRVERTLDGGLDQRIEQLRVQCPGWSSGDDLADDMVVIMFSPVERENSIFYGADLGPVLEARWDPATDAMIPHLRRGDYTDAVDAALLGLQTDAGTSSPSRTTADDDDGGSNAMLFLVLGIAAIAVVSGLSRKLGWTGGGHGSYDDGSDDAGWSRSGRRRRSFSSFGSSRSSRSSSRSGSRSRSRSSGSRGSRRAGGGTKKW